MHLADEVAQHGLGDVEVGDDAVLQRADGLDVGGGATEHGLGLDPDGEDGAVGPVHHDDGGLVEHDPLAAHVHEGVGSAEVNADLARVLGPEQPPEPHQQAPRGERREPRAPRLNAASISMSLGSGSPMTLV